MLTLRIVLLVISVVALCVSIHSLLRAERTLRDIRRRYYERWGEWP
jgi:hypothetical protein